MRKKYLRFSIISLIVLGLFIIIPGGESKLKTYYSGDAIGFRNSVFVGTTNTGNFEMLTLENGKFQRRIFIKPSNVFRPIYHDVIFNIENNELYVYLVNGDLYKYHVDPYNYSLRLIAEKKDNSYDYFYGLGKQGENIVTIGSKGVKIWKPLELVVVNSYDLQVKFPSNIAFTNNGNYIADIDGDLINIIDGFYRNVVMAQKLTIKSQQNRQPFIDDLTGEVFVADDVSLRKYNFSGLLGAFMFTGDYGYDVDGTPGQNHVYFSDGIGIVKSRKSDLAPLDWVYTTRLGLENSWAMGLEVVRSWDGEKIIVFNAGNILALNDKLELEDYYLATEPSFAPVETMSLKATTNEALPGTRIMIEGTGFNLGEEVSIVFPDEQFKYNQAAKFRAFCDQTGSFSQVIVVPQFRQEWEWKMEIDPSLANKAIPPHRPLRTEIKATGLSSGLTYSIGFTIL